MPLFCHICLLVGMLACLGACAWAALSAWKTELCDLKWIERAQLVITGLVVVVSLILFRALALRDFSFASVADYTDTFMPMFYALTAFWGGQNGSMLFWLLVTTCMGSLTLCLPGYKSLPQSYRLYFWIFFLLIEAFFFLLLTGPSNPFVELSPAPPQGRGLNPLLQNPGMIFHPPLLFMGYAGFTVPCCMAFAGWIHGDQKGWLLSARNWTIVSWVFLSAGILLGMWWAYMELGWGGYWAWDPVENASLVPWISASALLHAMIIGRRQRALYKTNLFLVALTLVLCFFGTFVVRSGYIDSIHAFGNGGVGVPLLIFMLVFVALLVFLLLQFPSQGQKLAHLVSRQGLLFLTMLVLGLVAALVFLGILWPVISQLWSKNAVGLDAGFYNRSILPFFALLAVFFVFCPWLAWKEGAGRRVSLLLGLLFLAVGTSLYLAGMRLFVPLLAASAAISGGLGLLAFLSCQPHLLRSGYGFGVYGLHLGLVLIVLGIAFSGPYQMSKEAILRKGDSVDIDGYRVVYTDFREFETSAMRVWEARFDAFDVDGKKIGTLTPQKRIYRNFRQNFAEVSVIPGLGKELYATLLGFDKEQTISLKISIHPLVNWIWIGGVLVCLLPFLALRRARD